MAAFAVFFVFLLALLTPLLTTLIGAFIGFVVSCVPFAAAWIVHGFAYLGFNIPVDGLVSVGATFGFIGGFFRSSQTNNNGGSNQ